VVRWAWRDRGPGRARPGFLVTAAAAVALNPVLEAGKEQGLVPEEWDPSRAAPFVANFAVVTIVAPAVEELTYRGLGVAIVRDRFGAGVAVAVTALAFGLAHGLLVALPILTLFGVVLAVVRLRTRSLYPAIALHAVFNGLSLLGAVLEVGS
jgi:membrane protease YdiL (CAAX protease family)